MQNKVVYIAISMVQIVYFYTAQEPGNLHSVAFTGPTNAGATLNLASQPGELWLYFVRFPLLILRDISLNLFS